jgi:hypothetical protein
MPVHTPAVEFHLAKAERSAEIADWDAALTEVRAAVAEAERSRDVQGMLTSGGFLERLLDYAGSARIAAIAGRLRSPSTLPEWDGTARPDKTLLVIRRIRHIGDQLRLARLIPLAARRVRRCIVLAEPRLVPLYQRSYPEVDVRSTATQQESAIVEADIVASYETLWEHLGSSEQSIVEGFTPLQPDPALVHQFRSKYKVGGRPLVGISWKSRNENKDCPLLADWAEMMKSLAADFVSLQYGDLKHDIDALRRLSASNLICDDSVDSMRDLDGFAAQVSALDAVVSISNTTAHMAGALGIKSVVILDDKSHLPWPYYLSWSPWYPSTMLIRRRRRRWLEVLEEVPATIGTPNGFPINEALRGSHCRALAPATPGVQD